MDHGLFSTLAGRFQTVPQALCVSFEPVKYSLFARSCAAVVALPHIYYTLCVTRSFEHY